MRVLSFVVVNVFLMSLGWLTLPASATSAIVCEQALDEQAFAERLHSVLKKNGDLTISAEQAEMLRQEFGLQDISDLMLAMIAPTRSYARPPISGYQVSAVGREVESGDLVVGVNLEFTDHALNQGVHGEQFVLSRVYTRNQELRDLAISAEPCGHCRQWLNESATAETLQIRLPPDATGKAREAVSLRTLLPAPFGPDILGQTGMAPARTDKPFDRQGAWTETARKLRSGFSFNRSADFKRLRDAAIEAAEKSYAPYTGNHAGVALLLPRGRVISGSYLENVAYNPSLSPLQVALVNLVARGYAYKDIRAAVLVERAGVKSSQRFNTEALLRSVAPARAEWVLLAQ